MPTNLALPLVAPVIHHLRLLSVLVDAVASAEEIDEIYEHALDGLEASLGIERSAVLLLDDERVARFVAWRGLSDTYRRVAEGHFPWPVDATDPPPIAVGDALLDPTLATLHENFRREKIGSVAFIPLVYNRRLLGKFMLYHAHPHEFTAEELAVAQTIGRLIAFAVARTRVERELRTVDRRKDEFLATLAHELRNPLAALSATVDVIELRRGLNTEREQAIARRQIQHLSRLIDDLLDLSRISRGRVALRKEPVELSTVLARAIEDVRPMLDRLNHELQVNVSARRLVADPVRLEQILTNLVGNAAKFTPPRGTITITAASELDQVVIRVRDTGIGISHELLPHVFDLFTQGERSLDRSQGGLGIGLTITKQLVLLHGGTVAAFSEGPGRGSEFVVTLPAQPEEMAEVTDAIHAELTTDRGEPVARPTRGDDASPRTSATRVLLVEDNLDLASSLAEILCAWGNVVRVEFDGMAALAAITDGELPDLAIVDIGLPEIDGYELARRFRAMPHLAKTMLVAMSGYGQPADIKRSFDAGFAAHLVKPVDLRILRRMLEAGAEESTHPASPAS